MNREEVIDVTPVDPKERRRGLTSGLVLVTLGLVFLGQSLGWPVPANWWALFILIPAIPSVVNAIGFARDGKGWDALRALRPALVFLLVAGVFLLNLDWSKIWPVFLIFAGVSMLLPRKDVRV